MDSKAVLYMERARNELDLVKAIFRISTTPKVKVLLELKEDSTFFSDAISKSLIKTFFDNLFFGLRCYAIQFINHLI